VVGLVKLHDEFAGCVDEAPLVVYVCERKTFLREVKLIAPRVTRSSECERNDKRARSIDKAVLLFGFGRRTRLPAFNHCQAIREGAGSAIRYCPNHQVSRSIDEAKLTIEDDARKAFREKRCTISDREHYITFAIDIDSSASVLNRKQRLVYLRLLRVSLGGNNDRYKQHQE
jgi:hypothetical protein